MTFTLSKAATPSKIFLTNWSRVEARWDPNYYRGMTEFRSRMRDCSVPLEPLKRSLALVQYGISERATEEPVGVPMLRMINLQDDAWDLVDLKYIQLTDDEKQPYLLQPGDILFNRTNSKELVGKCCVFDLEGEYVFASYLIRVRVRPGSLRPEYVTAFLSSGLGRIQIDAVSRQIAGMTNVNAEEIRALLIPALDGAAQNKVVTAWKSAIRKRDRTLDKARAVLATIDDVLLDELGIHSTPAPPNTLESRIFQSRFNGLSGRRWDPLYHQADIFQFVRSAKCDLKPLGRHADYFVTGFPAGRADQVDGDDGGVIQIRPTNLSDDRELIFRRNVYIAASALDSRKSDVLRRGEVLFNNTNSQERVGKTVCFDLDGNYFCSNHITRIGTKENVMNPLYLASVLNLYQRRKVFFKLCTNWNNQSGVGNDILQRVPVPLPHPTRQSAIVSRLQAVQDQARNLREQARDDLEKAKRDIESIILGREDTL